jgi:hypothetical protein
MDFVIRLQETTGELVVKYRESPKGRTTHLYEFLVPSFSACQAVNVGEAYAGRKKKGTGSLCPESQILD